MTGARAPSASTGRRSAVAAGFTVLFVTTGVNFSFGILFKPILVELGAHRSTLALAATASLLVNALGQPIIGALSDRVGPRRVILPSMALMALGTGLVSIVQRPWQLIALYGVAAALGYTGAGILPISVHITRWFPAKRAAVMALAASGFSLGHLVFTQLAAHAELTVGWRGTYLLLAAILMAFLGLTAVWLRDAPRAASPGRGAPHPVEAGSAAAWWSRQRPLRDRGFWCATVGLMGCGFTDFLLTTHLAPFATDLGLPPTVAANAISLWAAANVVGILLAGAVAVRIGSQHALVLTYLVRAASLFLLVRVRDTWQLYLFAVLFGATFFTTAPLSATLLGDLYGPAAQGALFGSANLFHHSAGALGAYAGGLAFDRSQSYLAIFFVGGLMILASAVVTAFADRSRPR